MLAEQLPTRVSDDDLKHYKRSARRYQLAKARFDVAQEAWDEEQAELAHEYRIDGNARIDLESGEITRLPADATPPTPEAARPLVPAPNGKVDK